MSGWGAEDAERHERLRNEVMRELVETEVAYVEHLKTIVQVFVNPIKAQGMLNATEVSNIFSNITLILTINNELMTDLLKIKKSKPSTQNIGEIFLKLADYLKMYTQYCSNQGRALAEIENIKKTNPQFANFLEECKKNERCQRQDIGSFIIKPIQRICKYPLLLKEIVQHTPKDHFDYENLLAAVAKMTEVVTDVNENKRKVENAQKLLEIQNAIVGDNNAVGTLKLVVPGRKFIQEGTLVDLSAGKEMERKYFLLNDILLLTRPLKGKNQMNLFYKLKDEIILKDIFIRDSESIANAFDVVNIETTKFYTVALPTAEEKRGLMQKLSEITNEYSDKARADSFTLAPDFDKRGGYSINLTPSARGKHSKLEIQAGLASGSIVFGQQKESEILILEKKDRELEKEHKKVRADFEAVIKSNAIILKKKERIRQQLQALNEEKEKFIQREFDQRMIAWDEARRKRDFINSEQRRKLIDEKRRKDELKDDTKELERVAKEVRRIKEEKDKAGNERTELAIAEEDQVSSYDWKRPYPRHFYKAFDLIAALSQDLNLDLDRPEIVLVGLRGHGKSLLLEALLGHQFTDVGYGATRRPLSLQIKNNADRREPKVLLTYVSRNGTEKSQSVSLSHFPEVMKKKNLGAYSTSNSSSSSSSMSTIVNSRLKERSSKDRKEGTMTLGRPKRSSNKDATLELKVAQDPAKEETSGKREGTRRKEESKSTGEEASPGGPDTGEKKEPAAQQDESEKRLSARKVESISFALDVDGKTPTKPVSPRLARTPSPRSFSRSVSSPRLSANTIVRTPSRENGGGEALSTGADAAGPTPTAVTAPAAETESAAASPSPAAAVSSPQQPAATTTPAGVTMPSFSAQTLADLGRLIHASYEYQNTFDMTIIDAPGLAFRSGSKAEMKETENVVRKLIAPSNRIILVVEEFIDAQSESASYGRNYLLDLVKQYDPSFARTVFVFSKFYHLMKHFTSAEEVSRQLALRPENSFYVSLFNEAVRTKLTNREDFQKKVIHCYFRDLMMLEKLNYDKSLKKRLGVNRLRRYLLELTWKRHKELIPQIPILIDTLARRTQDRRTSIISQLDAAVRELENDRQGRTIKLRFIASRYLNEFLSTIFYSLESNFSSVFNVEDLLADYDLFDKSRGMVRIGDTAQLSRELRWRTPFWDTCLGSGGAQLRKLLSEFRQFVENLQINLSLPELQAIPSSLPPLEFMSKAAEVAEVKFREAFAPFVEKLFRRTAKIFARLCEIVDTTLKRKSSASATPSAPFPSSLHAYRFSAYTTAALSTGSRVPGDSSAKAREGPDMFHGVNGMFNDLMLGKKLKYSSPQLAFCVKDYYHSHMKRIVALARDKCLDEIRCPRLVYFPTLLVDERIRSYATGHTTLSRARLQQSHGSVIVPREHHEENRRRTGSLIRRPPQDTSTFSFINHAHKSNSPSSSAVSPEAHGSPFAELRKRSSTLEMAAQEGGQGKINTPPSTPTTSARGGPTTAGSSASPPSPRVGATYRDEPAPPSGGGGGVGGQFVVPPSPASGSGGGSGVLPGRTATASGTSLSSSSMPTTPRAMRKSSLLSSSMERNLTLASSGVNLLSSASNPLLSSLQETEDELQKDFVPLARRYFNDIRDRIARNTLLKYQEFCLVPLLYERSVLTSALQRKLTELSDDAIENLFDITLYVEQLKRELSKLDETLKVCEQRRELFQSLQPAFCHPATVAEPTAK